MAVALLLMIAQSASAAPPTITNQSFSGVTTTSATLEGEVNPEGKGTEYHFEYGLSDCSANPCTALPKGKAITGTSPVPVEKVTLEGLTPHTTYHFRLIARHPSDGEEAADADTTFTTYSPPQVFGSCPNDALRSGRPSGALPDCRAYEQASPVDKNGMDARGRVALMKAATNGAGITYGVAGNIPGAEGSQDLPTYLATRSPGGWSTQGLFPPQSAGQSVIVMGWTPDLSQTYTTATRLGPPDDTAFLQRSSADHSLAEVIPYGKGFPSPALATAGFGFTGTSGEGAQVVVESKAKLTPAALEGKPNVYAWDKASGKLSLASALNDASSEGKAPPAGAFAGSYDWISGTNPISLGKGGAAASYYTQDSHAISTDGAVIFTSAGDGQLHMRRNPSQAQSAFTTNGNGEEVCSEAAKACTSHISASEKDNGTGLEGHDAAGTRPAAFLAASPDGSNVLFSSSEKLTNDATTGTEPSPAGIGRANLSGSTDPDSEFCQGPIARGVAVDGSHLYWADPSAGTISRAGLECESPEVLITGAESPQYVTVDSEHLYWTNTGEPDAEGDFQVGEGTIGRAKLDAGGAEEVDQEFIEGATNPQGIAVQGEFVYWSNAGEEDATRTIGRAKLGAGGVEEVDQSFVEVGDGSQEYTPQGLAVNPTHLYVTIDGTQVQSYVFRYDINGDPLSKVQRFDSQHVGLPGLRGVALDATHIYWARQGQDSIGRCDLSLELASCDKEFIKEAGHPLGLTADATHLFWAVNGEVQPNPGSDLYRYEAGAPAGERLTDLAPDPVDPNGAEVKGILGTSTDTSAVYFVANGVPAGVVGSPNATGEAASLGDCKGSASGLSINFSGQCNLYLAREGKPTTFIARLNGADAADWVPRGGLGDQDGKNARVAVDGSSAIFFSERRLTDYDSEGISQIYRYDAATGEIGCISCVPTEAPPQHSPSLGNISLSTLVPPEFTYTLSRNLSADGNRVFFESVEALVGEDTNGEDGCQQEGTNDKKFFSCQDAYEWEAAGHGSCEEEIQGGGCLYLLSSGKSPRASFFADASATGADAFIATSEAGFVRQDQDQLFDIFDVRTEGGLAAQSQVGVSPCGSSESCLDSPKAAPTFQTPTTESTQGTGNVKPKCPKGKKMKKGRCVAKKKARHHKKHKRAASHKGGQGR